MPKQLKLKFYTGQKRFLSLGSQNRPRRQSWLDAIINFFYFVGLAVIKFFGVFFKLAAGICFHTGSIIIAAVSKTARAAAADIKTTVKNFPRRAKLLASRQSGRSLAIFSVIAVIGFIGLQSLHLVAKGFALKNKIITEPNPIENLDYNPILKRLLIKYIVFMYESETVPTELEIWQEYLLLLKDNQLNRLFIQEFLENTSHLNLM